MSSRDGNGSQPNGSQYGGRSSTYNESRGVKEVNNLSHENLNQFSSIPSQNDHKSEYAPSQYSRQDTNPLTSPRKSPIAFGSPIPRFESKKKDSTYSPSPRKLSPRSEASYRTKGGKGGDSSHVSHHGNESHRTEESHGVYRLLDGQNRGGGGGGGTYGDNYQYGRDQFCGQATYGGGGGGGGGGYDVNDEDLYSRTSQMSVADTVISRAASRKGKM
jgi:hypothetical protein